MIQHQTANTDKAIKHQEQWRRSDKEEKCLQSFRTINNTSNNYEYQKNLNPPRVEDTCLWFLQNSKFLDWKDRLTSRLLWVTADPGCGKSVLSKALIDESLLGQENNTIVCYYFFKDTSPERRSPTYALSALLHQLFNSEKGAKLISHALPAYIANKESLATNIDLLWSIIQEVAEDPECPRIIFLLDALDECESKSQLDLIWKLKRFEEMRMTNTETMRNFQFLVTSRPYWDIEKEFQALISKMPDIRLQAEEKSDVLRSEIKHVIEARLDQLVRRKTIASENAYNLLRERISGIVNRTYLWVHLVFQEIGREPRLDVETVQNLILPPSVFGAYEAILRKSKKPKDAKKLLHIVVGAKRPLSLRETATALYITEEKHCHEDLELQGDEQFKDTIRDLCGLFVSVVDEKVFLIHQTAKEFLVNHSHTNNLTPMSWKGSLVPETSNLILAKCCLSYLLFDEFRQLLSREENPMGIYSKMRLGDLYSESYVLKEYISLFPERSIFLDYSARMWYEHLREVGPLDGSPLVKMCLDLRNVDFFFFRLWFPFCRHKSAHLRVGPSWKNLVLFVAYLGLNNLMVVLPIDKMKIDVKDQKGRTALIWAAKEGHEVMVELLIKNGANVNVQGGFYGTALQEACANGDKAVVRLLLEKGADVNIQGGHYSTALRAACLGGREAVVRLLLEKGADVNVQGDFYSTVLQEACANGHEAVVRLLLEKGADVNIQGGRYSTALRAACERRHEAIVKLLLQTGKVNIDSRDNAGRTLLSHVAEYADATAVEILLQICQADPNSKDNNNRTPISWAAEYGNIPVMELFLQVKNIEFDSKDKHGYTPLLWAAGCENAVAVDLLLKTGRVEVDSRDINGRTPLSRAAKYNRSATVQLLLETGKADIESRDKYGRTPLLRAARYGSLKTVELLLETEKVQVNLRDVYGRTALSRAAEYGHLEVIEMLLKTEKVQVDLRDAQGRTPLSWAVEWRNADVVKSLVRAEANADLEDTCGRTWAAVYGNI
jgi:ankyrin repeat protein